MSRATLLPRQLNEENLGFEENNQILASQMDQLQKELSSRLMRRKSSTQIMKRVLSTSSLNKSRYNQAQSSREETTQMKQALLKIFQFYASFGERTNLKLMRSNKFHRLMRDAEIPIDKTSLDILYVAETKHKPNMNFEGFLNLLVKISTFASTGSEDPKSTFEYFFEKFMVPLYEQIMQNTYFGSITEIVSAHLEFEEIEQVLNVLLDMYRESFGSEFHKEGDYCNVEQTKAISETDFQKFCLDYEILPFYISKAIATNLWENLLDTDSS